MIFRCLWFSLFFCGTTLFAATGIKSSIAKGVDFLVKGQNPDGSWGTHGRTKMLNIFAPGASAHLSFRNSTSSLCLLALLKSEHQSAAVKSSIKKGLDYLVKTSPGVKRASEAWVGNVWTHAYTIKALLAAEENKAYSRPELVVTIKQQIARLETYQYLDGGWGYYDFNAHTFKPSGSSTSFLTGTCLIVLKMAQERGYKVSVKMTSRALAFLARQRKPDNTFLYSNDFKFYTNRGINKKIGSLARSQPSLRALYLWEHDDVPLAAIEEWVGFIIKRNVWLDMARKRPVPHESWNQIAAYFYYYGMYYAGENLDACKDKKKELAAGLSELLIERQEINGSWFDFPLYNYGHFYGTAYALLALKNCAQQ